MQGYVQETCTVLTDGGGAPIGCACVASDSGQLVLGRTEAIYLYGPDERGPCFAFDGPKHHLTWHRSTLLVITAHASDDDRATGGLSGGSLLGGGLNPFGDGLVTSDPYSGGIAGNGGSGIGGGGGAGTQVHTLQLYDLKNKFIACHLPFTSTVKQALSCGDKLIVCLSDGQLFSLEEKPWSDKLNLLYRKNLFSTAIS